MQMRHEQGCWTWMLLLSSLHRCHNMMIIMSRGHCVYVSHCMFSTCLCLIDQWVWLEKNHKLFLYCRCGVSLPGSSRSIRTDFWGCQECVCGELSSHCKPRSAAGYFCWWLRQLWCWMAVRPNRTVRITPSAVWKTVFDLHYWKGFQPPAKNRHLLANAGLASEK